MKSKDVLKILGISRVTLWTYVKKGLIKVTTLPNGYYNYDDQSVYDFIGKRNKINIIYSRVSAHKQKDDLDKQTNFIVNYCHNNNIHIDKVYSEISSGIDLNRDQLNSLLHDVFTYNVDKIFVTNKDRLTILSFATLENILKQFGASIVIVNKSDKLDHNEMFDELSSLTHLFSTKEYSKRKNINL
jgi:putative resolvase